MTVDEFVTNMKIIRQSDNPYMEIAITIIGAQREALETIDHETVKFRIWDGLKFKYNPPWAKRIHDIALAALEREV